MASKSKTEAESTLEAEGTETQDEEITEEQVAAAEAPTEESQPETDGDDAGTEESSDGNESDAPEEHAAAPTPKQGETATMKAFDTAQRRAGSYVKAVVDVLGEAAQDLNPCPRCADFLPGFIVSHAIRPVTPEQRVAVKVSMGEDAEPEFILHKDAAECPSCRGWGKVLTGSHVRNQDKVTCPNCHGRGYVGPLATVASMPMPEPVAAGVTDNGPAEEPKPDTDPWGRMKGDPNYGILPGYELN